MIACRLLALTWLSLVFLVVPARVVAESTTHTDASPLVLEVDDCDDATTATVATVVALELHGAVLSPAQRLSTNEDVTHAAVRCDTDRATLVVHEPGHSEPLALTLNLAMAPLPARPRLLALALSELIVSARMKGSGVEPAPAPPAQDCEPEPSMAEGDGVRLWAAVGASLQGEPTTFAPTVHVGASLGAGSFAGLVELRADIISRRLASARVQGHALSALVAPALVGSLGKSEVFGAVGLRLGYLQLSGESPDENLGSRTLTGFLLEPAVCVGLRVGLSGPVGLRLAVEGSYVAKPLRGLDGEGQLLYLSSGIKLGANLGLALSL